MSDVTITHPTNLWYLNMRTCGTTFESWKIILKFTHFYHYLIMSFSLRVLQFLVTLYQ